MLEMLRFIPNREGQDLQASFSLLHDDASPATPSKAKRRTPHDQLHFQKCEQEIGKHVTSHRASLTQISGGSKPDLLYLASIRIV